MQSKSWMMKTMPTRNSKQHSTPAQWSHGHQGAPATVRDHNSAIDAIRINHSSNIEATESHHTGRDIRGNKDGTQ